MGQTATSFHVACCVRAATYKRISQKNERTLQLWHAVSASWWKDTNPHPSDYQDYGKDEIC
jgi:hypothetical protein